jgi:hypothetical protein
MKWKILEVLASVDHAETSGVGRGGCGVVVVKERVRAIVSNVFVCIANFAEDAIESDL